jgi:hypothetical protein
MKDKPSEPQPDLPRFLNEQNEELRSSNRRLVADNRRLRVQRAELVEAVYEAARDAASGLQMPPVKPPPADRRRKTSETAIAVLSDWQLAKVTSTYSSAVCEERIERYADKLIELTRIQRADHPVNDLRAYLLGDLIEGEQIFPGQAHHIDASLYMQVMVDGPRILGNFIRRMEGFFPGKIHVAGVSGNHGFLGGRTRKDYHPESNGDTMLYEVTRIALDGRSRATWSPNITKGARHWYALDTVGEKTFFLFHGDQVRGYNGFPWYGMGKKVPGWFTSFLNVWDERRFHYVLHGHFHTPNRMYLNGLRIYGNGSTESHNPYALEQLAAAGEPMQWLLYAHPRRGISAEYEVALA